MTDDERFLRDQELKAAVQQDLAAWRDIQNQPDYFAEPARDFEGMLHDMEELQREGIIYRRLRENLTRYLQRDVFRRDQRGSRARQ